MNIFIWIFLDKYLRKGHSKEIVISFVAQTKHWNGTKARIPISFGHDAASMKTVEILDWMLENTVQWMVMSDLKIMWWYKLLGFESNVRNN